MGAPPTWPLLRLTWCLFLLTMSLTVATVELAGCECKDQDSAAASCCGDGEQAQELAMLLLQTGLRSHATVGTEALSSQLPRPPPSRDELPFYRANPTLGDAVFWNIGGGNGSPSAPERKSDDRGPETKFVFGEGPAVLAVQRRPVRLGLDLEQDGTDAPGYNPSLLPLPQGLAASFPEGRWVAALRAGDEKWFTSPCQSPDIHLSPAAAAAVPDPLQLIAASEGVDAAIDDMSANQDRLFRFLPRSWFVVLDAAFRTLAKAKIQMKGREFILDEAAIQDVRLFQLPGGELIIGFHPNYIALSKYGHRSNRTVDWRGQEAVAQLHLSASPQGSLEAWVELEKTRTIQECPEQGLSAPGAKHNLGFFQAGSVTYVMDWLYPTMVGELNTKELLEGVATEHLQPVCFGDTSRAPPMAASPWQGLESFNLGLDGVHSEAVRPHNGPPLLWIEELGEYLGVSHLERRFWEKARWADTNATTEWALTRYTHQFFTLAGDPSSGKPWALRRLSPEVCLESAAKPGDCDRVQLVSSALRVGAKLQLGYGVMDCEGFVASVPLAKVLAMLRPL